jgi:uncharacterized protein
MFGQGVTLITLGVGDLTRSRGFYESLGMPVAQAGEGVVFFQLTGQVLAIFGIDDLAEDQGRESVALGTGAMTLARNFATVEEVNAAYELALGAGAKALKRPEKVFWGGYSGYFADPDGHVWEVAMNPFWRLSGDGTLTLPKTPPG